MQFSTYRKHLDLEYCTIGPGARKGLNYLPLVLSLSSYFPLRHGYPAAFSIYGTDVATEQFFWTLLTKTGYHWFRP